MTGVGNHQRTFDVSNRDKVLFPEDGVTKGDLIDYYDRVAETMLPHVRGRVVTMRRFPDGIEGEGFYQKEVPDYFPDWIATVSVRKEGGSLRQLTCEQRKNKRGKRVFIDYLRNTYGQHGVAPYSVRPRPGAPVATPLDWEELGDTKLEAQRYRIDNLFRRLSQKNVPWHDIAGNASSLKKARRKLDELIADEG